MILSTALTVQATDGLSKVIMICASTILLAAIATIFSTPAAAGLVPIGRSSDSAPFAINIGTQGPNDVVWVHGQSQCNNVVIGPVNLQPFPLFAALLTVCCK